MKRFTILIAVAGAIVLCSYLFLRFRLQAKDVPTVHSETSGLSLDLRPLLIDRLKQMVKDGSGGLYQLSLDSIQADVLQSEITLFNAALFPDSQVLSNFYSTQKAPDNVYKVRLQTLHIDGLGIKDVLSGKSIELDTVFIQHPVIEVYHRKMDYNLKEKEDSVTLYQRLFSQMKKISIKYMVVQQGTVTNYNLTKKSKSNFNEVTMLFKDVLVDSATQYDSSRFLFAKDAVLSFRNYNMRTADGLYNFNLGFVQVSASKHQLTAEQVILSPRYNKKQFQKKLVSMKEQYNVHLPKLQLQNINWWNLANEESLEAESAEVYNARVGIYLDRSLPPPESKVGNYPHQLLMKLPLRININRLKAYHADVSYEEFNPNSGKSGKFSLNNINAEVNNISNIREEIKDHKQATVTASARLMNHIPVKVDLQFDLWKYRQGNFLADIHIAGFDATKMNAISEPLGMVTIKSCKVKEAKARVKGDNYKGTGKVRLLYHDLHITALKKNDDKSARLQKKRIFSFIANAFVIKNDNPKPGEAPRQPDCFYKRDPECSFFNLLWKTMLTGVLKTAGANPKLAGKQKNTLPDN
jgi:hypothetical protein